jgi:hypothetical protein
MLLSISELLDITVDGLEFSPDHVDVLRCFPAAIFDCSRWDAAQ